MFSERPCSAVDKPEREEALLLGPRFASGASSRASGSTPPHSRSNPLTRRARPICLALPLPPQDGHVLCGFESGSHLADHLLSDDAAGEWISATTGDVRAGPDLRRVATAAELAEGGVEAASDTVAVHVRAVRPRFSRQTRARSDSQTTKVVFCSTLCSPSARTVLLRLRFPPCQNSRCGFPFTPDIAGVAARRAQGGGLRSWAPLRRRGGC